VLHQIVLLFDTQAFDLLQQNCCENGIVNADIVELNWGDTIAVNSLVDRITTCVDWLIASDCFYDISVFEVLLTTIDAFISKNTSTRCLFAFEQRE
jgi:hypothetical protein